VSAIYDRYDTLKPALPQAGVDVDWVFVTDDADLKNETSVQGWRVVYEPRPGVHPNRAAKRPKFLPWEYTDAPRSVWVDGAFRIVSDRFAAEALQHADPIAQFVHPWRDCLYDEAAVCIAIAKYKYPLGLMAQQAEAYRQAGHPAHWGLWATGVIARQHTDAVRDLGHRWLAETDTRTFQDQISHPFVLREVGLRPAPLPGDHLTNAWLVHEGSGRH
jgi:hypothetical protein